MGVVCIFKQRGMETNRQTNKQKHPFLRGFNLDLGDSDLNVSVPNCSNFPVKGPSLPVPTKEIAVYFLNLCFCFRLSHWESTNSVMWLCSVALIVVMEAVSALMKENGKRIEHVNTLRWRGGVAFSCYLEVDVSLGSKTQI